MTNPIDDIKSELENKKQQGTYKIAPVIDSPMDTTVKLKDGSELINLCSNNYLGLANHPDIIASATKAMREFSYGTASVRFICGTFTIHEQLERELADFLNLPAATTYVSCWNANEALIPTLLGPNDVVISDELNHASIIDACRLCNKQTRKLVYKHSDMNELKNCLEQATDSPGKLIITDGVFSMEGDLAKLPDIVELAKKHNALVAIDDSHAHGVIGKTGRGTPEYFNTPVDIITGTLGKALGGAAGGFIAADEPVIELLVQKSRPQLFSNALPPATAAGALTAIKILKNNPQLIAKLTDNTQYFRTKLKSAGFDVIDSPTAIVPIIVGQTAKAISLAQQMRKYGILITGFGYPVVPKGTARLRAQISAAHTKSQLDKAIDVFKKLI